MLAITRGLKINLHLEDKERPNKSSDLLRRSSGKLIWDQFNMASVQRNLLTRGWQTPAAPEDRTGSQGGTGS